MDVPFSIALLKSYHAQNNVFRPMIAELGLSVGQPKILGFLARHDGCMQKDLAAMCDIEPATISRLLDKMDKRRNLGLFSATISREVMDIAWVYQRDAEEITVREDEQNKPDIKQFRMDVPHDGKADAIEKILNETGFDRCMAFCNTKGSTERITKFLQMRGIDAQCIHGDIPQKKREQVMDLFRKGKLRVFVSTDVAARGIDVDDVDIVFNCDIPDENQDYVHRIGRTGRAKRQGVAVSFVADFPSKIRMDDIAKNTRNEILPVKFDENGKLTMV